MNYFIKSAEREGSCYHEFIKGKWDGKTVWSNNSVLLHDDTFNALKLYDLFALFVVNYDTYGITQINEQQWQAIYNKSKEIGGEVQSAIEELNHWCQHNFQTETVFTVLGI